MKGKIEKKRKVKTWTIYGLVITGTTEIRYVGQTSQDLQQRLYVHLYESKTDTNKNYNTNKGVFIRENNLLVSIVPIIENIPSIEQAEEIEQYYINYYLACDIDLANTIHNSNIVSKSAKKVYQYDLSGEFVREWQSAKEAYLIKGYSSCHISSCANGKKRHSNGFIWSHLPPEKFIKPLTPIRATARTEFK